LRPENSRPRESRPSRTRIDRPARRRSVGLFADKRGPESEHYIRARFESLGLKSILPDGSWFQSVPLLGVTTRVPDTVTFRHGGQSLVLAQHDGCLRLLLFLVIRFRLRYRDGHERHRLPSDSRIQHTR
jgi:hypothetical protein